MTNYAMIRAPLRLSQRRAKQAQRKYREKRIYSFHFSLVEQCYEGN